MTDLMSQVEQLEACFDDVKLATSATKVVTNEQLIAVLRQFAKQLEKSKVHIKSLKKNVRDIAHKSDIHAGYRPVRRYRKLSKAEKRAIKALVIGNQVTTSNPPPVPIKELASLSSAPKPILTSKKKL